MPGRGWWRGLVELLPLVAAMAGCFVLMGAGSGGIRAGQEGEGEEVVVEGVETIEVLNWNTYHLFDHKAKLEEATEWLAEEGPDVLALQEMLHIDEEGLGKLARKWGHGHAVMHKEHGYPVALTSREEIEVVARVVKGFHHGYLHARTMGIEVFVVHFWPSKAHEAVEVAELAAAAVKEGRDVLVVGDFNAFMRRDEEYLRGRGLGREVDGEEVFDWRITDAFAERGFVDLVAVHSPKAAYSFGAPALIPRWAKDMDQVRARRQRIDFVLASPGLAKRVTAAGIDTDDEREGLYSDHYPVRCTLRMSGD